jgi:C1A family cysteine protease
MPAKLTEKIAPVLTPWYGWKPDIPDFRDLRLERPTLKAALPEAVDLRPQFPPAFNQGEIGSCTANAIAAALRFESRRQKQKDFPFSRLFIYYCEREVEGTVGEDAGAMIRTGIKVVAKLGAPPEAKWKYVEDKFTARPPKSAFTEAAKHQAIRYQRVTQTGYDVKAVLASGQPIVFGFSVYDNFEGDQIEKDGLLTMPDAKMKMVGGHAVLAVGYLPGRGIPGAQLPKEDYAIVLNSWDVDWGVKGCFYMPMRYLLDPNLADDFWCIQAIE